MKGRLLVYLAVVVILTGLGVLASVLIFGEEATEVLPEAVPEPLVEKAPPPEPVEPAPIPAEDETQVVRVMSLTGSAERGGEGDDWSPLAKGDLLDVDEAIKTDEDAQVTLGIGDKSTVEVSENAELRVREINNAVQRFRLDKGRVSVDYKEDGERVLRIENQDGSAVAETKGGMFSVLNTGTTVAVATKTGSVDLSAAGEAVTVAAGEQSVVNRGAAPSRPSAIPVDVLLRVVDPGCRTQREMFITLHGKTDPGSAVAANGTPAVVNPKGRFSVRVPLKIGKNRIAVVSTDPSGRQKTRAFHCINVDPGAPIKEIDIKWGTEET